MGLKLDYFAKMHRTNEPNKDNYATRAHRARDEMKKELDTYFMKLQPLRRTGLPIELYRSLTKNLERC